MGQKDKSKPVGKPTYADKVSSVPKGDQHPVGVPLPTDMTPAELDRYRKLGQGASNASNFANKKLNAIPGVSNILDTAYSMRNDEEDETGRVTPPLMSPTSVPKSPKPNKNPPQKDRSEDKHNTISSPNHPQNDQHDLNAVDEANNVSSVPKGEEVKETQNQEGKIPIHEKNGSDISTKIDPSQPDPTNKINASSLPSSSLNNPSWADIMEEEIKKNELEMSKSYENVLTTFKTLNLDTKPLKDLNESIVTESKLSYWEGARDVVALMASLYHKKSDEAIDTITSCSLNTNSLVNSFKSDIELLHASIGNPKIDLANILKEIKDIKELVISNGASASRPPSVVTEREESKIQSITKESKKVEPVTVIKKAMKDLSISLPDVPTWDQLKSHLISLKYTPDESEKITKFIMSYLGSEKQKIFEGSIAILQSVSDKCDLPEECKDKFKRIIKKG